MKGNVFVLEGMDGCGKHTQTGLLYQALLDKNLPVRMYSYPCYGKPSARLVQRYLNGDFGSNAEEVNPYMVSVFYAQDRLESYLDDWKDFYNHGGIILLDRYTTSNMVYQSAKLSSPEEKEQCINWIKHLEYTIFGLPEPDKVFFLDIPPEISLKLRQKRGTLKEGLSTDIHEKDTAYLEKTYHHVAEIANKENWHIIHCTEQENLRSIESIHQELLSVVLNAIGKNY